jgi:heme-degrading monooxygenase HmoA
MIGVTVEFRFGGDFDPERISEIAHEARGRFEGLPGLRQKAFTLDRTNRRALNVYLWDSEEAARAFFDDALVERVTGLYGVAPTVTFVEVAELVDNG